MHGYCVLGVPGDPASGGDGVLRGGYPLSVLMKSSMGSAGIVKN